MTSSASSIFQNSIDFGASGYDVSQFNDLTLGAQSIITAANDGGSSTLSVAFSFEVLGRSQSAVLLKTGDEILYDDPSSKTADYLVEINGHKIGVTTTRAVGFPPGTLTWGCPHQFGWSLGNRSVGKTNPSHTRLRSDYCRQSTDSLCNPI